MPGRSENWHSRIGRHMKLRDLQIFSTVVTCGSMASGARQLGITQPAVSASIANLEAVVGERLLDRGPQGVEPTVYGKALFRRGHVVFDELKQGLQEIQQLTDPTVGQVRVACPESLSAGFLPAVVDRMMSQYPRISVSVIQAQTAEQDFSELRERSADVMLGRLLKPLAHDDVAMEIICDDRFVVVAGTASRWASRKKIVLKELVSEKWIMFPATHVVSPYIEKMFRATGIEPPNASVETFSMHLRLHLLSTGRFLTIMQGSIVRFHAKQWSLRALPIVLRRDQAPIVAFTLKNRTMNPALQIFLQHARTVAQAPR
jgi:DNA-binding transcriptional LysR family regulator